MAGRNQQNYCSWLEPFAWCSTRSIPLCKHKCCTTQGLSYRKGDEKLSLTAIKKHYKRKQEALKQKSMIHHRTCAGTAQANVLHMCTHFELSLASQLKGTASVFGGKVALKRKGNNEISPTKIHKFSNLAYRERDVKHERPYCPVAANGGETVKHSQSVATSAI